MLFVEAIIAPKIEDPAKEVFDKKKNLRILELEDPLVPAGTAALEIRRVLGGILVQNTDVWDELANPSIRVVTPRQPSEDEWRDLRFAWTVVRHVKSNAIVLASDRRTSRRRSRADESCRLGQNSASKKPARAQLGRFWPRMPSSRSGMGWTLPRKRESAP